MPARPLSSRTSHRTRSAFTLVELIVVIVVLAILSGVAVVKYIDMGDDAKRSADVGSISAINEALQQKFGHNTITGAAPAARITAPAQVAAVMETGSLPYGISLTGSTFSDQRGNTYILTAETPSAAARLGPTSASAAASGSTGGGASGGSPSGSTGSGGSGSSSGSASIAPGVAIMALAPWLCVRPSRRTSPRR